MSRLPGTFLGGGQCVEPPVSVTEVHFPLQTREQEPGGLEEASLISGVVQVDGPVDCVEDDKRQREDYP